MNVLPEGVVARYLTANGVAVDVVDIRGGAQATCGCGWTANVFDPTWPAGRTAAAEAAQAHAEVCAAPPATRAAR